MASSETPDEPQEIIGMHLPGIEDYTNDFSDDSDDGGLNLNMSNMSNKVMIRHSFHLTSSSMKEAIEEIDEAPIENINDLELDESDDDDEDDSDDSDEEEEDENEESDFSSENEEEEEDDDSSSWGSEQSQDFGEGQGGITYLSVLQQQPDNATKFTLTPFESVVDDATKCVKIKYAKTTYPIGSRFYSEDLLNSEDYHRLQNVQLVEWIKSDSFKNEQKKKRKSDDLVGWLMKSIDEIYRYYRGKDENSLNRCYHLIDGSVFEHFSGDGYKYMLREEDRKNYKIFKLFELLLHTFARLSSKLCSNAQVEHRFYYHLDNTKKMFPKFKSHCDLLKDMHKAHIDKRNANHCIQSFVHIYHKNQKYKATDSNIAPFELAVKALVALDLYMENYSPLNHSILCDKAAYDIDSEAFKWLDYYDDDEEDGDDLHALKLELCGNPQSRINKLITKYKEFSGFSFLRARVSWVIGHSKLYHQRNFFVSEQYIFESLFCLKKLQNFEYFPLLGQMETELASLVLIDYADVLLENKKYEYSIIALEKVIECFEQRQKFESSFQIIRKLCVTCTEKEDWQRAIKYHNITLRKLKDNYLNLNEFVYLSQQISTIHLKLSNFNQSEKELQNGIKTIYLNVLSYVNTTDGSERDQNKLKSLSISQIFKHCEGEERISIGSLILVLSNLYLSGGNHINLAINLLHYLEKNVFTSKASTRRILILFQLSRAYFKHGRYENALDIIETHILPIYPVSTNKLLSSLEFLQLRVLVMIRVKRYDDALKMLEDVMNGLLQKESFVKRAKMNYLKGRILQHRCFDKLQTIYEKQKKFKKIIITDCDKKDTKISIVGATKIKHRRGGHAQNSNQHEIDPLDAQSAFLMAHSEFRSVQDPAMQTKCCLELGKTYLEIMMEYYALPRFVLKDEKSSHHVLQWLGVKIFNAPMPNEEVITHCLDEIKSPLYTALNLSVTQTKDISLLIECYIALAEFEFLKSQNTDNQKSKNFWKQSKISFFATFKDSDDWIFLRRIDRHSRLQIFCLFKRMLRLLICFDSAFIAENVQIFESYIALETFIIAQNDIKLVSNNDKNEDEKKDDDDDDGVVNGDNMKKTESMLDSGNAQRDKSRDFMRYSSNLKMENGHNDNNEDTDQIEKNPTVTFRINDKQSEELSQIQIAALRPDDINDTMPLFQRYRNYSTPATKDDADEDDKKDDAEKESVEDVGGEKYLDELFRMHWKMRTESNMFSGGRITEIDNDKALVQITKSISSLRVELDIKSTLNREHRCWAPNETFIISLDSIIFIFHPHTLRKEAISKQKGKMPSYPSQLYKFEDTLKNIAYHDSIFVKLDENPWLNEQHQQQQKHEPLNDTKRRKRMKKKNILSDEKTKLLLTNELSLPYLKLESIKELLMCLDPQNILNVLGAIISERQIIIISSERCRALAIMDALFVLIYPFSWQYPCIPWLSPNCAELLNIPIPYIFGVASLDVFNLAKHKNAVIIDSDTNALKKQSKSFEQLPLKIKSKLTRAMFRLMSALLKSAFQVSSSSKEWFFPPRRRDNINTNFNLLSSPHTAPISICSERKTWFEAQSDSKEDNNIRRMIINFQKEVCAAWVEVLEQYRLFRININDAHQNDQKAKSSSNIQKYAHPRYRSFLTHIQEKRLFSSFQCIRSLPKPEMLASPMFDNLVMRSLKWRQSLYHKIIEEEKRERGRMKVSVHSNKRHFMNHDCTVTFDPKGCKLFIEPDVNFVTKQTNKMLSPFEVILKATDYELESDENKLHPYIDPKIVQKYGQRYQFKIKHQKDGLLTLNCQNYYQLTRWLHMIRTHSMDTWSWFLKF